MSKVYVRVFVNARIHRAQNGHLRANIQSAKAMDRINERVDAELGRKR